MVYKLKLKDRSQEWIENSEQDSQAVEMGSARGVQAISLMSAGLPPAIQLV